MISKNRPKNENPKNRPKNENPKNRPIEPPILPKTVYIDFSIDSFAELWFKSHFKYIFACCAKN